MNQEIIEHNRPPVPTPLHNYTMVVYALYAVAFVTVISLIVGVIMAYRKRNDAVGSIYYDHLEYLIKTFWMSMLGFIIGIFTMIIGIGGLVVLTVSVWFVYRVVAGFIKLNNHQSVSADSWF